jgi:hypothetical protein
MKLEFIFLADLKKKSTNTEFHGNPSSGSKYVPCGQAGRQADRHDEANGCFL